MRSISVYKMGFFENVTLLCEIYFLNELAQLLDWYSCSKGVPAIPAFIAVEFLFK